MSESILVFKVVSLLLIIFLEAKTDADHLNKRQFFVNHTPRFIKRGLFVAAIAAPSFWLFIAFTGLFWGLFDQALNLLRKDIKLFYIGSVAKTDSFAQLYPHVYWGSKILGLIVSSLILLNFKTVSSWL